MALQFSLVKRKDMHKNAPADQEMYYGMTRATNKLDFNKLCEAVANHSTASRGDVMLVLDGLIFVMTERLQEGSVIQMGNFGNFQMVAGSKGVLTEVEFATSLFNKAKITFRPGALLRDLPAKVRYEKASTVTVTEECTKEHVL